MSQSDNFPVYQPPQPPGMPVADSDQAKPMVRAINKLLKPKLKMPKGRGVQSDQSVHVKHKKVKFY